MNFLGLVILGIVFNAQRQEVLADSKGCERRYMRRINGKCYYFSVKKLNWFGSLNNCLRKGLVLADLNNAQDFQKVIDFLSSKGNTEDFWFSGNDLQHEGRYQYVSNGRLVHYFSNNSLIEPAEHSDCNDCLEVRIRENTTVVSDDNCLERQYFICSERYCDNLNGNKKKRHHSHEHLHHFHHDIGSGSDEYDNLEPGRDVRTGDENNMVETDAPVTPEGETTAQTEEQNGDGTWGEQTTKAEGEGAAATEGAPAATEGAPAAEGAPETEGAAAADGEIPTEEAPAAEDAPAAAEPAEGAPDAVAEQPEEGAPAAAAEPPPEGGPDAAAAPPAEGTPDAAAAPPAGGAEDDAAPPPAEGAQDGAAQPAAEGATTAPEVEEQNGEGPQAGDATEAPAA